MNHIETDYLVIGAGTAGLAFADTLIDEIADAHVTLVDRHGKPGGHWNDAYPFVTLHQPSAFYGVNSMELGTLRKDTHGLNQGLYELASGPELSGYFERVMNHKLLPSGRVSYHPMCSVLGAAAGQGDEGAAGLAGGPGVHEFESLLSGARTRVAVRKKVVDAAYFGPSVPATHRRRFEVAPGVRVVPPNALPSLGLGVAHGDGDRDGGGDGGGDAVAGRPKRFVILGAGKTAMDAVIWLIGAGASPQAIQWVMPRDSWLLNRTSTQPAAEFFKEAIGGQANQMQAFAEATSVDDLFLRLEACETLLRIDRNRMPTMFHFATVAPGEVEVLRRIDDVVRLGRVQRITADHMLLEKGQVPVAPGTLFVDCTASSVEPRPVLPIFQGGKIVLQLVRLPQPAFSAALIAFVEAHYDSEREKNRLCSTVPFPHRLSDYPRAMMANLWNQAQWGQDKVLRQWVRESRLDGFGKLMVGIDPQDAEKQAILARLKTHAMAAMANLPKLVPAN